MEYYKEIFEEETLNELHDLINSEFCGFYCTKAHIDIQEGEYKVVEGSLSYKLNGKSKFLNITNDWYETPLYKDYYKLSVEFSDRPADIQFLNNVINSPVSMHYKGLKYIDKIEIYNCESSEDDEQIVYDSALCFYFNDGYAFIISVTEGISGLLLVKLLKSNEVKKQLSNFKLRRSIT